MSDPVAIAVVGVGAILPDAPDVSTFWKNIQAARYSITDVPPARWNPNLFYDADPLAPDKTYSKIGGWVSDFKFDARGMGIAIPPRTLEVIDGSQQWAIAAAFQALQDYGYPQRPINPERIAVILGSALGGENHYRSTIRIHLPEYIDILASLPAYQGLSADVRSALEKGLTDQLRATTPAITEDTMPGELSNIIAGRVANVFNFSGPNFVTDAACASALAALQSAIESLMSYKCDAVLTGGVDRNMGPEAFVKFSKIGALSPDGSRPYAEGANGFVMGEGAGIFLLKRLEDAERDGDKIYAVIRGVGGSSDGKGKGITAPNPIGQQRAMERAWQNAGVSPATAGLIEGHGTSTPVGDLAEVSSLNAIFGQYGLKPGSIALGSVKSNFGHLKSAAGAAGLLKTVLALYNRALPPSVNFKQPNAKIDFAHTPLYVNTETRPWDVAPGEVRRAGVSAFGFGGTNFHVVVEEYLPGMLIKESTVYPGVKMVSKAQSVPAEPVQTAPAVAASPALYRGLLFVSADSLAELRQALTEKLDQAKLGHLPSNLPPSPEQLGRTERLTIDFEKRDELIERGKKALKALEADTPATWQPLSIQGIYRGSGRPGKVAFLFPGQGSQYVNMLRDLREVEPIVGETFREADVVMTPLLGRPLTSYIFVDGGRDAMDQAELKLRDTVITQPAILTVNVALLRVMAKYGFRPDFVIGHSLGEYAALVASGVLSLTEALEVVSARGKEMSKVNVPDKGCMAAVSAPLDEVEKILKTITDYVVIANINSPVQCVIGGTTVAVEAAIEAFLSAGFQATKIPVSHAFHTSIVAPASQPLRQVIARMNVQKPAIPIVANVTGELYPTGRDEILDILAAQVASPVQFVQGIQTLYEQGARVFAEIGPKRVLSTLAVDILKGKSDVTILSTNHPRKGGVPSFHEALCRLYAAGVTGIPQAAAARPAVQVLARTVQAEVLGTPAVVVDGRLPVTGSVVISGAGLGLPGLSKHVFDDNNILSILHGDMRIDPLPDSTRQSMLDKRPTRVVKSEAGAMMQTIDDMGLTIKLAGQRGKFDPVKEFGMPQDRLEAIDISTQLAIAAGIEALRDASIPLVMAYKRTSTGSYLPDHWKLPEPLADETGVIFCSAFPGLDRMADEADRFYASQIVLKKLEELRQMAALVTPKQTTLREAFARRIAELDAEASQMDYHFDRRYIFRVLAMGHSQFAEYIGARGPNTHVNAACASTTHAMAIAEDWIRNGRARRVVVVSGDDVISGSLSQWIGTSLMASGAATAEGDLRLAALPFDKRRNGMIIGMGAAALVVESEDAVRERGVRAICELLSSHIANSAFHGTRLNVGHVSHVMQSLLDTAEQRFGISREEIAPETVFVSHETYTPARGGSASAEIHALRDTFGGKANQVVIANTKGFTGHTMGVGIEDVIAVKALEYGLVPPIANIQEGFEPDPELGDLNLSHGGEYPVRYSLRLGAGFGSQIAMTLMRKIPGQGERVNQPVYQRWLSEVSGYSTTDLEVVKRTLRIHDQGTPPQASAVSHWQYGQGPTLWAETQKTTTNGGTNGTNVVVAASEVRSVPSLSPVSQPAAAALPANLEEIKAFVVALVSEKTGYPAEVLDLDLDLEADLGIDTVKQAELLAAIRGQYGIARREDLRLSDFNTLAKVIGFVTDSLGQPVSVPQAASAVVPQPVVTAPSPAPSSSPAPQPVAAALPANLEEIKAFVVSLVSEKTGYPAEVLDLDLDLEADLGIDTVKQAELLAAIRGQYGIARREDLRLSDFNTLAKVIGFVTDSLGQPAPVPQAAPAVVAQPAAVVPQPIQAQPAPAVSTANIDEIKAFVLSLVSEKTGYPAEVLDLDLDLEADLGIDTVKQAELLAAIRGQYGIARREDLRLSDFNTLAKVIGFVTDSLGQPASVPQAVPAVVAQPAAVVPQPAQPAPAVSGANTEEIKAFVLALVSEKTGYPAEVLDLNLDLEADLGIDTVKQAELLAAIRGQYGIARREDLRLSDFNTLAKVMAFVTDSLQSQNEAAAQPAAPAAAAEAAAQQPAAVESTLLRRVPLPTLRPRLDLCLPTGVTLGEGSRVLVVDGTGKTGDSLARKLEARKVAVVRLSAAAAAEKIAEQLTAWIAEGPIQGVYFLPALDIEPSFEKMTLKDWQAGLEARVYSLYTIMRALPDETFLVCGTRLGGLHGYSAEGATAPMGGATSGFAKAVAREREAAFVKVVDFETKATAAVVAGRLIDETLSDPGAVEIGWEKGLRYGIAVIEQAIPEHPNFTLETGSVFVVSGGASGIMQPIVDDLAKATQGTFYLVDRAPLPEASDSDIERLTTDRDGLKLDLIKRHADKGEKVTPVQVEQELLSLERSATAFHTLKTIRDHGGKANYLACDVTDPKMVQAVVDQILKAEDHIDVFIHAAGLERSRKLSMKPPEEFRMVVGVKSDGLFNLMHAMESRSKLPRSIIFFCSIAGRFGNSGQTDYSAANDLLCKIASSMRNQHPEVKALALDWSAWAGIGMASRGNIPELMKMMGIDMVQPGEAAPRVRAELLAGSGEIVLAGSLGTMVESRSPNGGMDVAKADAALRLGEPIHTMLSHITDYSLSRGLVLETELDPSAQPFLYDHALNGTPVLPGVMGIEGFSIAAKHIGSVLASEQGGLEVGRLEDIRFLAAFKFYRSEPRRVTWVARAVREAAGLAVYVTLESTRVLKTKAVEHMQHFSGKVYLEAREAAPEDASVRAPKWNGSYTVKAKDIYQVYFHGPAFQVLEGVQRSGDVVLGKLHKGLPATTAGEHALVSTPILVELCFQTAGIWEIGKTGSLALPRSIESLTLHRQSVNGATIYAEVTPAQGEDGSMQFDARVVDSKGRLYLELKNYRTTPLPYSSQKDLLAPIEELVKDK